jgi:hypothetical protein
MKTKRLIQHFAWISRNALWIFAAVMLPGTQHALAGTWTPVATTAPGSVQVMLLMSDGTVACSDGGGGNWYRLAPNSSGSYINGTITNMASMNFTRRFGVSTVLRNGRLLMAGGEYGTGWGNSEVYNPLTDTWTTFTVPAGLITVNNNPGPPPNNQNNAGFTDSMGTILPNGNVIVAPNFPIAARGTIIFNGTTWVAGPSTLRSQNEAGWVKLPDDSLLTVDKNTTQSERYIPSLNQWINDDTLPVSLFGVGSETGPALLLPDGRAWFLGATTNTAFYTPSGTTNQGSWAAGPPFPNGQACPDAPAAMLVNGKVLFVCSPVGTPGTAFPTPASFYEYDPVANVYTRQNSPTGGLTENIKSYNACLLCLPDGNVLYSDESSQLYVYTPTGSPIAAGKPAISSMDWHGNGSLRLNGTKFNGISQGSAYGDDEQMDSNYPIIRLTSGSTVYYARTHDWSSTSVATGSDPVWTEFDRPAVFDTSPNTPFSLRAVANGNASDPLTVYGPVWVDFNYSGFPFELGWNPYPYNTLAEGVNAVTAGGTIAIKASSRKETILITKAMTIISVGGSAIIGN